MKQTKYISKYSNNKEVSAAQYITELVCEKRAKVFKLDLHYRFWTNKEWSAFYRNQIGTANKLLKYYEAKVIIRALKNPQTNRLYSLRSPVLVSVLKTEASIVENENQELTQNYERKTDKTFSKNKTQTNIISKIKDLDDAN